MAEEELKDAQPEAAPEPVALARFAAEAGGQAAMVRQAHEFRAIVKEKAWGVQIGGSKKEHLTIEAWLYLGGRNGVFPQTEWSREVRDPKTGPNVEYQDILEAISDADRRGW